jgi:hypothetical protein
MANSRKVASAYVDLQLQIAQFKAALGEADGSMRKFSAEMREQNEKSRESVRLLSEELRLGIPRGLQGIISKLPGVSTAMNLAFDSVVVFALIRTVMEVTEKVTEFAKKSEEAAQKTAKANAEFQSSLVKSNAELVVANDKISDNIAKLSHKPENLLKDAIDEAALASINLSDKLDISIGKMRELLDAQSAGWFAQLIGTTPNDSIKSGLEDYQRAQHDIDTASGSELQNPKAYGGVQKIEAMRRENHLAGTQGYYNNIGKEIADRESYQHLRDTDGLNTDEARQFELKYGAGDQSSIIPSLRPHQSRVGLVAIGQQGEVTSNALSVQEKLLQANKVQDPKVKAYFENMKKNLEDQLRRTEEDGKQWDEAFKATGDSGMKSQEDDRLKKAKQEEEDLKKAAEIYHAAEVHGYEEQISFAEKFSAIQRRVAEAHGTLTPHAVAIEEATAHLAAYNAQMDHYRTVLGFIVSQGRAGLLSPEMVGAQSKTVNVAMRGTTDDYHIQKIQDAQAVWSTSFEGGMDSAFEDLIKHSQDFNAQFKDLLTTTVNDINGAILKLMTDRNDPHPFRAAGKAIFGSVAKTGLQDAEGNILKLLGMGGKKAQHVIVDNMPKGGAGGSSGAASAAGSGLLSYLNNSNWAGKLLGGRLFGSGGIFDQNGGNDPGSGESRDQPSESGIPGLVNSIGQMAVKIGTSAAGNAAAGNNASQSVNNLAYGGPQPETTSPTIDGQFDDAGSFDPTPRASGGIMSPGDWYLTGEEGPELMQVGSTSKINNARDTSAMLSGGGGNVTHHHWDIDARGANDPAAINAAVQRGIMQAAPHIVAASNAAQGDHGRRSSHAR